MTTIRVKDYVKTIKGKVVYVPAHNKEIKHALGDDFEALLKNPKVHVAPKPIQETPAPVKIHGHLLAAASGDFDSALQQIKAHEPKAKEPDKISDLQAMQAGEAAFKAGLGGMPVQDQKWMDKVNALGSTEEKVAAHAAWNIGYQEAKKDAQQKAEPAPEAAKIGPWQPKPEDVVGVAVYHNTTEGHNKVYKVTVLKQPNGKYAVVAQWGKQGGSLAQQVKMTNIESENNAHKWSTKLIKEKEAKGYVEADPNVQMQVKKVPIQALEEITTQEMAKTQPAKVAETPTFETVKPGMVLKKSPKPIHTKGEAMTLTVEAVGPSEVEVEWHYPDGDHHSSKLTKHTFDSIVQTHGMFIESLGDGGPKEGDTKGALTFHNGRWHAKKEIATPMAYTRPPVVIKDPHESTGVTGIMGLKKGQTVTYGNGVVQVTAAMDGLKPSLRLNLPKNHIIPVDLKAKWMPMAKTWQITLPGTIGAGGKHKAMIVHSWLENTIGKADGGTAPMPKGPAAVLPQVKVGMTKMENGNIYVLNANHKWELVEDSIAGWKQVGEAKGSNPGGSFLDQNGKKWYVKWLKSKDHVQNEILASKLYEAAGLGVPDLKMVDMGGKIGIASAWKDGLAQESPSTTGNLPGAKDGFVVDAWLCNRDAVGEDFTNLVRDPDGKAYRVDVGGSLIFRAMGGPKPGFGNDVAELQSMLNPGINTQTSTVFQGITQAQLEAGATKVLSISDEKIKGLVDAFGPGTDAEKAAMVAKLIARKGDIGKKFPEAAKKAEIAWVVLKTGEEIVETGEEFGVKWAKIKVPPGGFKAETIPTPPTITSSGSAHYNNANTAAAKMIYDTAIKGGAPEQLQALEAQDVDKGTGAPLGTKVKLAVHHSQHVKNYMTAVLAEVNAQHQSTFKTEYNGSFTGSFNEIAAKMAAQFKAKAHVEFKDHAHKAADYLVLSPGAVKGVPVPSKGFTEKTGTQLSSFKNACASKFNTLSSAEQKACSHYTGSAYDEWNEQMRAGTIPNGAKPMVSAMAKAAAELPEGTILWRGIGVGGDTYKSVSGALIQDGSFQSCSYGDHPAFAHKQTWLRLHIGKGVKALHAAGVFSNFGSGESEIILPPNCRYAVLKVTDTANMVSTGGSHHGKKTIVDILVLPNDDAVAKEALL